MGGSANGHSLLNRRTHSKGDSAVDDRTGAVGARKKLLTVLVGVDATAFEAAFLAAVAPDRDASRPAVKGKNRLRTDAVDQQS